MKSVDGLQIVVVEDEKKTREGIIKLIQKIDFTNRIVGEAANGIDGIKTILALSPDVVFVDIKMPKLNGLDMIERLRAHGVTSKFVILTAYSEFQYAQKAIKLGAYDYLLKPIIPEDIEHILCSVQKHIQKEQFHVSSIVPLLAELLTGNKEVLVDIKKSLNHFEQPCSNRDLTLVLLKVGEIAEGDKEKIKRIVLQFLSTNNGLRPFIVELHTYHELILIFVNASERRQLKQKIETLILPKLRRLGFPELVIGYTAVSDLEELKDMLDELRISLKWCLVLGEDRVVDLESLSKIHSEVYAFPQSIEKDAVQAIWHGDWDRLAESVGRFLSYCKQAIYDPSDIITASLRFVESVTGALRAIGVDFFNESGPLDIYQGISKSVTWVEVARWFEELIKRIKMRLESKPTTTHSVAVRKIMNIVNEDYMLPLSLKTLAAKLNLTPEYLSHLFHKETGICFSDYLCTYRMRLAKELLLRTDSKVSDIARRVGYPSSKYFSYVFRRSMGLSPSEYAKIHR